MADRIHFKLDFNGSVNKFASAFIGEDLYNAVKQHVAFIVNKDEYDLFWNDEVSDVVLLSSSDLSTAIDYAKCMRKSDSKSPCVRLTVRLVGEEKKTEVAAALPEMQTDEQVAATESVVDPMTLVKEHLLQMCKSALDEQWSATLRTQLDTLITLKSDGNPQTPEYSAADIAVQVDILEAKIPEELKDLLVKLKVHQLAELLISDWLEEEMTETMDRVDQEFHSESVANAVSDVKMLVEFVICQWKKDTEEDEDMEDEEDDYYDGDDDQDYYDDWEKEKEKRQEEKKEYEKSDNPDNWLDQQALIILRMGQDQMFSSYMEGVYSTPEERLEKAESDRLSKSNSFPSPTQIETATTTISSDPAERFRQYLLHKPQILSEKELKNINFDYNDMSMKMIGTNDRKDRPKGWTHAKEIASMISRLEQSLPSDLQQKLHEMQPEEISRVAMLDWLDSIREEDRMEADQDKRCQSDLRSPFTLHAVMYFGATSSMFPDELRNLLNLIIGKKDELLKMQFKELGLPKPVEVNEENRKKREIYRAIDDLNQELKRFLPSSKVDILEKRMFICPPWPKQTMRPEEKKQWMKLFEVVNMKDEMEELARQQEMNNTSLHDEMSANLHLYVQNMPMEDLKHLRSDNDRLLSFNLVNKWIEDICRDAKDSQTMGYSPSTLAALLIGCVTTDQFTDVLIRRFKRLNIKKAEVQLEEEEMREMEVDESPRSQWIDRQAAALLDHGLQKLAQVFEPEQQISEDSQSMEPVPMEEGEATPSIPQNVKEETQDRSEREKGLKIREKALKMKEEVFERKVAEFEVKMEEFEETLNGINARVEEIEETTDTENLESRMEEMKERLKKVEEKDDDDEMEIV